MFDGWGCSLPPKLFCRFACEETETLEHFINCEKLPKNYNIKGIQIENAYQNTEKQKKLAELL